MRGLAVFLFFCVALASATLVEREFETKNADKEFLVRQKNIFHLLYHVHQPNIHKDQVTIGRDYTIEDNLENYNEPYFVKQVLQKYKGQFLQKGKIFSVVYEKHMHQAEDFYKVFFYAKNYDTFYKTACWAREYLNEQLFVYALSVAVLHRPDCQGMILPPPYEIHPYYFFNSEVIHQAYAVKMRGNSDNVSPNVFSTEDNVVIINSNYSGWYVNYNEEQQLSYFTEDIGLNSLYYYYHLDYPFWMNGEEFGLKKDKRGELFYYFHQQLLARYYLERLSNGLGEIPRFSWNWPVKTGYYPSLKHHNGLDFPSRPNEFVLSQEKFLNHLIQVEDYESRIREAIDLGYLRTEDFTKTVSLTKPEDIEKLGDFMAYFPKYYKNPVTVAKKLLGNSPRPMFWQNVAPSALEQYQTCLRDPMFYQMYKRYIGFFTQFQNLLKPYTKEELSFPGVKIENVEVDKMVTYFDRFDVDITNVVDQTQDEATKYEDDLVIKARQFRLNHKPFTVTTNLEAEKPTKVVFKFFLGPKFDGQGRVMTYSQNRENFVELDQFVYELKSGKNTIERNSNDFMWNIKDWTSSRQIYNKLKSAISGDSEFPLDMTEAHNGFPRRLALPRGRKGGMPFTFFVMVHPFYAPTVEQGFGFDKVVSSGVGTGARALDAHPFGYPFDRPIEDSYFYTTNMHFEDVLIFHKTESEINTVNV